MSRWLTRAQVAEKLNTHPNSIYRLEQKPDFPKRSQTLGVPRWREDEIDLYMEKGRAKQRANPSTESGQRPGRPLISTGSEETRHDS